MWFLTCCVSQPQTVSSSLTLSLHFKLFFHPRRALGSDLLRYGSSPRVLHLISSLTGNFSLSLSRTFCIFPSFILTDLLRLESCAELVMVPLIQSVQFVFCLCACISWISFYTLSRCRENWNKDEIIRYQELASRFRKWYRVRRERSEFSNSSMNYEGNTVLFFLDQQHGLFHHAAHTVIALLAWSWFGSKRISTWFGLIANLCGLCFAGLSNFIFSRSGQFVHKTSFDIQCQHSGVVFLDCVASILKSCFFVYLQ